MARSIFSWLIAATVIFAAVRFSFSLIQPAVVPTRSMEPTVRAGEIVLIDRTAYSGLELFSVVIRKPSIPSAGDVIFFELPCVAHGDGSCVIISLDEAAEMRRVRLSSRLSKVLFLKRVIGVGGDHVVVSDDGRFSVNGKDATAFESADFSCGVGVEEEPRSGSFELSPAAIFVVGDCVGESQDSRHFGPVHRSQIFGRFIG